MKYSVKLTSLRGFVFIEIYSRIYRKKGAAVSQTYAIDQIKPISDVAKHFSAYVQELSDHKGEKIVVSRNNRPVAVLLSLESYEEELERSRLSLAEQYALAGEEDGEIVEAFRQTAEDGLADEAW